MPQLFLVSWRSARHCLTQSSAMGKVGYYHARGLQINSGYEALIELKEALGPQTVYGPFADKRKAQADLDQRRFSEDALRENRKCLREFREEKALERMRQTTAIHENPSAEKQGSMVIIKVAVEDARSLVERLKRGAPHHDEGEPLFPNATARLKIDRIVEMIEKASK